MVEHKVALLKVGQKFSLSAYVNIISDYTISDYPPATSFNNIMYYEFHQ